MVDKWHDEEEYFLRDLEKQCNIYYDYFMKDHSYYNKLSTKFNVPILIISAMNALCAIALNDFLAQRYVSILNAVLSSGTGIIGSIQLYLKINEKLTHAVRASIQIKKLALKISKELTIGRAQRGTDGQQFLSDCFAEFNTIIEQANPIERKIKNFLKFSDFKDEESEVSSPKARIKSIANSLFELSNKKSIEQLYHSDSPRSEP
jgi:hypothetical protein